MIKKIVFFVAVIFISGSMVLASAKMSDGAKQEEIKRNIEILKNPEVLSKDKDEAIKKLGVMGESAAPLLIKAMDTEDIRFMSNICRALFGVGDSAVPRIFKELEKPVSSDKKTILIGILGEFLGETHNKKIISGLTKYLYGENEEIRREAARALANAGEVGVKILGEQLLKEKDTEVKQQIINSLKNINSKSALIYLNKTLNDKTVSVDIIRAVAYISDEKIGKIADKLYNEGKITKEEVRKNKEESIKGNLGALRTALTIYYSDNDGVYPETLDALVPRYIEAIPDADTGIEGFPVTNKVRYGKEPDSRGGWLYNNDKKDTDWINLIYINCNEKDTKGAPMSGY
ncbi:MAG: hypothetical protein CVU77_04275 [Elusimicrobia bacterium HGW-Elusimicrobia-1]|jgi:HEAT repeat protein|nr:MAG: hypothetical protein CVU77_04275 [Elusimicrobia bacterium HGW-Elusimicrobia-1]